MHYELKVLPLPPKSYNFKKTIMKKLLLVFALMANIIGANAQNDAINNETILQLLSEGFSSEEIIGAIENSTERSITYSLDFMRQLKTAGADANLTTYIQKVAKTDFGYEGIMWWNPSDGGKPKKVYRTQFEKESKSMNLGTLALAGAGALLVGSAVSGSKVSDGVAAATTAGAILMMSTGKDVQKLMLPGTTSKIQMTGQNGRYPVFRFYFPKEQTRSFEKTADNWYQIVMASIESPNEFQCIKMDVKQPNKKGKGGRRLFPQNMSYSIAGFEGTNASNRNIIDFEITDINNSTFEVSFPKGLEPGEYVFFYKGGLNSDSFKEHPFGFDFSVK
jgi:hypothetical protein